MLLLLRLQIVQRDAREVRDDDVARDFILPPFADQMPDVIVSLRFGGAEILPPALVLDDQDVRLEEVDEAVITGFLSHWLLEAGYDAAADAENFEEFVPEGLLLGCLAFCPGPLP
jgi:hypothetical protein